MNTAQAATIAAAAEPTAQGETPTVTTINTCGGDDVSYQVPVTTSVTYDGVQYDRIYATTNSVITFGQPDGTYWTYPNTPSISIASIDWVVYPNQRNDEHLVISSSDGGFQVDLSARPIWNQTTTVNPTNIVVTAAINTDGTVAISYVISGPDWAQYNPRTGARLNDGTVVPLEQANIAQVEEVPVLTPEPVEPTPTPSPTPTVEPTPSPTPTVDPSPSASSSPTPSLSPSTEPSPTPSPTPTQELSPSPSPTPTLEPSPSPTPTQEPTPEPSVTAQPAPAPAPQPEPAPAPTPAPVVREPIAVLPEPVVTPPEPTPSPEIEPPAPEPVEPPAPEPAQPAPVEPEPAPPVEVEPAPVPEPAPPVEPVEPAPIPAPTIDPIPAAPTPVPVNSDPSPAPISINSVDVATLPPDTPVELENGVVLTAEVVVALVLLENPAELIGAIFTDPAQALMALGNIGADMSPQVREQSEKVVISAIIAGGIATQAASIAAASTYRRNP